MAPKDRVSAEALGILLKTTSLPVAAYSSPAADAMADLRVQNVVTTAPTLSIYVDAFIKLMGSLRSNLVTIVDNTLWPTSITRIVEQLRSASIHVAEVVSYDHPAIAKVLSESDSQIILSYIDKEQFFEVFAQKELISLNKMWVIIPADGEGLTNQEQLRVLQHGSTVQVVSLQPKQKDLAQFKDYFLRVLKNNYQSYSLLTAYVQQVFNCSMASTSGFTECASIDRDDMAAIYKQATTVESVVRLTYALAVAGARLENNSAAHSVWYALLLIVYPPVEKFIFIGAFHI
ncbi:unnamed protein product [Toxocara canis]|uniref:Receptor ligand binding region domain-containing protein n=1 Tax=Toxocara canis TaxID=6265 RepID=A0A3P7H1E3_TOXCA|nr:unnamed protein product [Toxocara canis]